MKRSPAPKRKTPLKRKRSKPRRSERQRDFVFLAWVHTQECRVARQAASAFDCDGPIEADHAGKRPMGRKADDDTCIPLCRGHHVGRHAVRGMWFEGFTRAEMRQWLDDAIAETREDFTKRK